MKGLTVILVFCLAFIARYVSTGRCCIGTAGPAVWAVAWELWHWMPMERTPVKIFSIEIFVRMVQ